MMSIKAEYDSGHVEIQSPLLRAIKDEQRLTNITMLILLAGISMAAIMGERMPCTANDKPAILYRMERMKLAVTIFLPPLA